MHSMTSREWRQLLVSYGTNILLYALALFVFTTNNYYKNFLSVQTMDALLIMLGIYIVVAVPLELLLPREKRRLEGKGFIAMRATLRFLRDGWRYLGRFPLDRSQPPRITREEKTAILFLLVKFYFLPVMINFSFGNWSNMVFFWQKFGSLPDTNELLLDAVFPFFAAMFLFVDTTYFIFGYSVEYPAAKNEVRSVEPTLFGWLVALLCYPPLNGITDKYFIWTANEKAYLSTLEATYAMRIAALLFLALYLFATLALGSRSSNLTNRGIVTWGPYAYIRHPAYVGKILGWWTLSIPFLLVSGQFLVGSGALLGWTAIYFFRALTEERHLMADPDYQEYCRKVRWRFVPGLI